ncbi:MAG: galactose ABC transporter substrate-binding protein [Oscillospiraceae bacterium]|jgi:methyl-galactoside transport system substrate-binding protein|nr:galactose ABC transporter substrate-binding protein [Oscillospiraceae bacterium]
MKKLFCFALILSLLCACFSSCGGGLLERGSAQKEILIGVSVYDQYDTFIGVLKDEFGKFVYEQRQKSGVNISVLYESASVNQLTQNSQIESFVSAGCDVMCVNLVDRTNATDIIDKAKAAGIPVVFFNRELVPDDLERWDRLYYVGAPAWQSGVIQSEILDELCKKDLRRIDKNGDGVLQYVMLEGEAGHQDAIMRTEGSVSSFAEKGYKLERLEDEIANWTKDQAETKMTQWIADHGGRIELVFSNNDEMALGAITALEKAGIPQENWPVIVGVDGTPTGLAAIKAGKMQGTVFNDAKGQAEAIFALAWSLATAGKPSDSIALDNGKYIRIDYEPVTPENVDKYIAVYSD